MVFDKIKRAFGSKGRDPFESKGLEGFSPSEQERILREMDLLHKEYAEKMKKKVDMLNSIK